MSQMDASRSHSQERLCEDCFEKGKSGFRTREINEIDQKIKVQNSNYINLNNEIRIRVELEQRDMKNQTTRQITLLKYSTGSRQGYPFGDTSEGLGLCILYVFTEVETHGTVYTYYYFILKIDGSD